MAQSNKTKPPVYSLEGARVAPTNAEEQLVRAVSSCLLWEDSFYEGGKAIVERIKELVPQVPAAKVHSLAIAARSKMNLRHVPLLLAVECAKYPTHKKGLADVVTTIIQRPDELCEILAIYGGCKKLSKQLQKGIAAAFNNFTEYQFGKYDQDQKAIKLRDALFLTHPHPKSAFQQSLFDKIANGKLAVPDTWETRLSNAGKSGDKKALWTSLLSEGKLGAMALLRNLRNMQEAKVDDNTVRAALKAAKVERVLPFRFIAAARVVPVWEDILEELMFKCVSNLEKLPGKTALIVDTSPSMWMDTISSRSQMTRFEAAAALAILAREMCENISIYAFNEQAYVVAPRRGFALRDALAVTKNGYSRGGLAVEKANSIGYDRLICLTDGQWHPMRGGESMMDSTHGSAGPGPLAGKPAYMLNVDVSKNGVGYGMWTTISGWSDQVLAFVAASEGMVLSMDEAL